MIRNARLAALAAALAAPIALAPAAAQTTVARPAALPTPTYRAMAAISDSFEIASSRLALDRSRNPRIRAFAQRMVVDHTATTQALLGGGAAVAGGPSPAGNVLAGGIIGGLVGGPVGIVVGAGIGLGTATLAAPAAPYATGLALDARHAAMLNELAALNGRAFDVTYARMQVAAHQEALALHASYAAGGTDPGHVAFARSVVPHIRMHLVQARVLMRATR